MPIVEVQFYKEVDESVPVLAWLQEMARRDQRIVARIHQRIERLAELGSDLRRPECDYLRDNIYELRVRFGRVNYRVLYFFYGKAVVVLSHGLTKEDAVPEGEIDIAVRRRHTFVADPTKHSYQREIRNEQED